MATTLTMALDAAQSRNARASLQRVAEGAISLLDGSYQISETATTISLILPDTLPATELRACIKGVSSLVGRTESGITGAVSTSPDEHGSTPAVYSV